LSWVDVEEDPVVRYPIAKGLAGPSFLVVDL
jgi:hypothetical protein